MPSQSRPSRVAAAATVPEPMNGSSTTPGRERDVAVASRLQLAGDGEVPERPQRALSSTACRSALQTFSGQVASSGRSTSFSGKTAWCAPR